jgi:hypothetical protein
MGMHARDEREECALAASILRYLTLRSAENVASKVVDIFNAASGEWSVAALSEARTDVAAASLPNLGLAFFAGGRSSMTSMLCVDRFFFFEIGILL